MSFKVIRGHKSEYCQIVLETIEIELYSLFIDIY